LRSAFSRTPAASSKEPADRLASPGGGRTSSLTLARLAACWLRSISTRAPSTAARPFDDGVATASGPVSAVAGPNAVGANAGAADAIPGRARPQTADAERARLERENQQLSNELANLKDYLLKNPSAQMVRVSKRDHVALSGAGGPPRDSTGNAHNVHAGR